MPEKSSSTTIKLSLMMFLQFFIWGAWFVSIGVYLRQGVSAPELIGTAYKVGPIAAIITPLILGLFADRYFSPRSVLGFSHLICAGLILLVPWAIQQDINGSSGTFFWILLSYSLFYFPTLGLTNTVAMQSVSDTKTQFPIIRVFGTIGWIAAGFLVGTVLGADTNDLPFKISAAASIALAAFSFLLPRTEPSARDEKQSIAQLLGLESLVLFKDRNFALFAISSLAICIPLQAYYAYTGTFMGDTGFKSPTGTLIWGQISEIIFMLMIPLLFRRLGVKWMLTIGIGCWVLRYALFAIAAPSATTWMILSGILLHGICYDFFFVTGQIYTDEKAPAAIRGQAQGLLVVLTQGVGMYIGALINNRLFQSSVGQVSEGASPLSAWQQFWWIPCITAAVILIIFFTIFREKQSA